MPIRPPADEDWYLHQSSKHGSPPHCPLAANDKCPRYYASQTAAAEERAISLNLPSESATRLNLMWELSDIRTNWDRTVGTWPGRDGSLRGVDNFCPEVTARIFGLYCSSLRTYPDEDARTQNHKLLDAEQVAKNDPRWNWMVVEPKHYFECHEYSVYGEHKTTNPRKPKGRKGTLSPKLRFQVFSRDGYRCIYCGASGADSALQVDHKISVASGGTDDIANLVTA